MSSSTREMASENAWHTLDAQATLEKLGSQAEGLSDDEARERLDRHGPNRLRPAQRRHPLVRLLLQFHDVLIYLLLVAAVVTALLQHWVDSGVILAVVIVNALIGFIQEGKAEKALEAISGMLSLDATVMREGERREVPAEELVPGDVVVLRSGDKVPADLRILEARELRIDEAMLTGESIPAEKSTEPVEENTGLGDRSCMAFSGTLLTGGQGTGVVTATGEVTEIGKISEMVSQTQSITTPLIRQVNRFGRLLAIIIVAFSGLTFVLGYFARGFPAVDMFMAAVALAVSAIPEGLPAIMTIVLAIGVRRMAARHAIIRRLPAVDTLGAVTVICTDKTGTLTRNEMAVTTVVAPDVQYEVTGAGYAPEGEIRRDGQVVRADDTPDIEQVVRAGVLCNEADLRQEEMRWRPQGDPMEAALLTLGMKAGMDLHAVRGEWETLDTIPFESRNQFMATLHKVPGESDARVVFVKGGPERVLGMCDQQPGGEGTQAIDAAFWKQQAEEMAKRGQRVLALATASPQDGQDRLAFEEVQRGLTMLGLLGMIDPPRQEALQAVQECHEAGIRVVMITGDHALTAQAIGHELGIGSDSDALTGHDLEQLDGEGLRKAARDVNVFARVSPEHKPRLVEAIQSGGAVVAMTGDGVNDAPALKRADVGIAMGIKGTEVSKEAAEMVLTDDNFASIAHAVEEGRTVYDNLRKAILFILPTNGGEGLTIFLAILLGHTLPLTPVQVLWVNMVTTVTLALALAFEPPESGVMKHPPRDPASNLLDRYFLWRIALVSVVMCAGTFGLFLLMRRQGTSIEVARTVAVNALVALEAFYLFNTRFILAPVLNAKGLLGSRAVLLGVALVAGFQLLFTYVPFLQRLFGTASLGAFEWLLVLGVGVSVLFIIEIEKWAVRRLWPEPGEAGPGVPHAGVARASRP